MSIFESIILEIFNTMILAFWVSVCRPVKIWVHRGNNWRYFWIFFFARLGFLAIMDLINPGFGAMLDFRLICIALIFGSLIIKYINKTSANTVANEANSETPSISVIGVQQSGKEPLNTVETESDIPTDIPDLSEIYPDYKEETSYETNNPIFNKSYDSLEGVLEEYIVSIVGDRKTLHIKNVSKITKARIIFSLITFLIICYIAFYHEHIGICFLVEFIAMLGYIWIMNKMNLINYIKGQIIAKPYDNMDYIIASNKQNFIKKSSLRSKYIFPIMLLICFMLFLKPHIIYEKNETGYAVRYYTLAILNEAKVEIPDEYKGEKVNEVRGSTFYNMFMIKEVSLPKYITEIRGNTFENSGLTKITIPKGVKRIGGHAFYGCRKLSEVSLPDSLLEIGSSAFRRCYSLRFIKIPDHTEISEKAFKETPTRVERY